jgi:hypothetical protein
MDKANVRCTRFGGGIDGIFVIKSANFDFCVHNGRNSRHIPSRHAELVSASIAPPRPTFR